MDVINKKIVEMLDKNFTATEIAKAVGLSNKQLFYRLNFLKLSGFNFKTKYYYNGDIVYSLIKDINPSSKEYSIITSSSDTKFKCMIISDVHMGSKKERLSVLNNVYDYCAKEGINIIINAGDLINGLFGDSNRLTSFEEQIDYVAKNYPFDDKIINFICLGNHDHDSLKKTGQDLGLVLKARRHDMVPIGYGVGVLNVKNDQIIVRHPGIYKIKETYEHKLIISGHSHKMKTFIDGNNIIINIPSLSDISFTKNEMMPGAVLSEITFNNGYFGLGIFKHLLLTDTDIYEVSESEYQMDVGKDTSSKEIKNIDDSRLVPLEPVPELKKEKSKQIEKFYKKYGK